MVPIKDKVNASKRAHFMHKIDPNDTYLGVNQQVNDDLKAHVGGSNHFMANAIQTSSKGELANYHHQSVGSPTTWFMLNTLKSHPAEVIAVPGTNKDLIARYLEPSKATARRHMVKVRKHIQSAHSNRPARFKAHQEIEDLAPIQQICSVIEINMFCFAILQDKAEIQSAATSQADFQ